LGEKGKGKKLSGKPRKEVGGCGEVSNRGFADKPYRSGRRAGTKDATTKAP